MYQDVSNEFLETLHQAEPLVRVM